MVIAAFYLNLDFFSRNCKLLTCTSDFFINSILRENSQNCKFKSCNYLFDFLFSCENKLPYLLKPFVLYAAPFNTPISLLLFLL